MLSKNLKSLVLLKSSGKSEILNILLKSLKFLMHLKSIANILLSIFLFLRSLQKSDILGSSDLYRLSANLKTLDILNIFLFTVLIIVRSRS